ncbi:MAG: alkane 1-monooxygenase [Chitinophagaceae bacterium]|nr:alkane 1-monooxygenase [Chitinophagaceae bacterium]
MKPWMFLQLLFLPLVVVAGMYLGGWYNYMLPMICFVIRPLLSLTVRRNAEVHDEKPGAQPADGYRYVALFFVPVLLSLTLFALYTIATSPFDMISFTGLAISVGIVSGIIGFTLAHEFIHRFNPVDRFAGHLLLLQNNYLHYSIEHIWGHHVYACTSKDPHTARRDESFYQFLPRAVTYTFINAAQIERRRLDRKNHPFVSSRNRIILFLLLQLLVAILTIVLAGFNGFFFLLLQSIVAIGLLHMTNYLQHYGLMRREHEGGQIEKVDAHHAWNSPGRKEGWSLFQLENHADHHMHPSRPYEQLLKHEESPEQPTGYAGMIVLALLPPVWFRIMNKRIDSFITKTEVYETSQPIG